MIQKPSNYETVQTYNERPKLPPGGYVLRIVGIKQEDTDFGRKLAVAFDIVEGEHMGFFKADFDAQKDDKKWKGTYRIPLDWSEEWKVRKFKTFIKCVEESNSGFEFNFNMEEEPQLKNKYLGGIFNRKEWEWEGKTGFATRFKYPATVDAIRSGEFTIPDDDLLEESKPAEDAPAGFSRLDDSEIPF